MFCYANIITTLSNIIIHPGFQILQLFIIDYTLTIDSLIENRYPCWIWCYAFTFQVGNLAELKFKSYHSRRCSRRHFLVTMSITGYLISQCGQRSGKTVSPWKCCLLQIWVSLLEHKVCHHPVTQVQTYFNRSQAAMFTQGQLEFLFPHYCNYFE